MTGDGGSACHAGRCDRRRTIARLALAGLADHAGGGRDGAALANHAADADAC